MHTKAPEESKTMAATTLPTTPYSVVWSNGHSYVLEGPHWLGLDGHGRPLALSSAELRARGWTLRPN